MLNGIVLIALSLLAVPSLVLSRKPDAKELLDKIKPYQGWIGLVACIWGLWGIISMLLSLRLLARSPIWWISATGGAVLTALLGFILGYGLINKLILSKNEEAKQKGKEMLAKLAPVEGTLGIIGIFLGIWLIITRIIFW